MPTFRRRKKRFTRVEPMQPQDAQHQPDNSPPTSSQQPHKQPLHSPNSTTTTTSNPNNNNNNNSKAIVCGDDEDRHASSNSNTSSARGSRRSSHIQPTTTATETEGDETETSPSPSLRRPAAHTRHSTDVPRSSGSSKGDSALGHDDRATWMARVKEVGGSSIEDNVDNNHNGEDDAHGVSKVVTEVVGQEQGARRFIRSKTLHDQVVRRVPTMSVGVDGDDSVDGNDSANMLACKHEDVIAESTLGTTAPADASSAATPTPSHNHQPTSTSSDTNNNSHDHHHTSSHSHSDTNTAPSPSRQTSTSTATTATTAAAAATATALEQEEEEASIMPGQVDTRPITPQRVTRRFRQLSFDLSTTHNNNNNNNNNNDDGDGDGDGDGDQTSPKRKSPIRQLSDGAARLWSPFKRKRRTQSKDSDTSDVVSPIKTQTRQPSSGTASVQSLGETGSPRNRSPSPQHNDSKTDRKLLLAGRTHRSQFAMEALRRTPTIFEEDEDDEDEEEDKVKETGATAQRRIDQLSGFGQNHSTQQTTSPPPFRRQPAEQHDDVPDAGEGNPTLGASRSSSASSASSSSSSSSTTSDQPKQRDRSDSQVPTKTNLMHCKDAPVYIALACCFIDDAMHGRLANGKNKMYFEKWLVQRIFLVHTSQLWLHFVYAVAILLATLTFFEPPSADSFKPWTLGLEFFCIMVFITDIGMKMYYMGAMAYWSKNWHKMQIVFVCLFLLDAVIFSITGNTIRFSRFVRPAILLGRHRELRHTYFIISAMLPRLAKVFTMMFAFIGLFGIIGIHIFAEEYTGVSNDEEISQLEGTFDNFLRAFLRLFVLFTTENYPYVVVPAYQRDSATFIFFFAFVYAGVFFLTAMLLGLVVSTYFDYTAKQIHAERKKEWRGLMRAFALLDPDGNGYVTLSTWFLLMRYLRPDIDRKQAKFFFELLDRDGNNRLDCFDFLDLREIMLLKIRPTPASELNTTMQRRQWTRFRILAFNITTSSWFHPAILAALAINALVACVYHVSITQTELAALQSVHVVFALVFVAEIVLTIVSEDWYTYIASKWNVADLFIIPSALLCHCLSFVSFEWGHFFTLAGNCLLFVRLLWVSRDARFGLVLIWNIIEAVLHLSYIMAVVMYLFGVAGTELFHGYTPADPTTAYYFDFGCNMGFRSMGCACFTLFQVMTTSNWQEPMNDLIVEAGWGSAVYFVLFFIMINLVLTDLLVAVTIEAFLLAKRHFQGISADAIHTAFVEIPEDDDDEEEEEDYMAPADDMRGSNGYDGGRGGGSGGDFSSGMGRNAPPSDPQPRRGTVVEQGKADVSREKSPAVLRLEADDLVHRARRRSFQSISVPVGQSERPSPHKDRTSIPVIISTRQQSLDSNPEHKRHQSIPIISETLVDAPTININNDSVDGDDGDDDEGTHLLSPVTRRQSSPATTTTTTTTTTTGATEAATTTSRKHLTLPSRVDSIGFDDVGNGMPSKQRSSSSSFALQNRQGWRRKSIRDRLRSIVRRSQAAKDPTLYRVYRCKQSWRREIAGQDEALELIEERDLDKMAKDARGLPIHSMHQHKYRTRSRKRHKAALRALEQEQMPNQTEEDLALKKISPILQWWAESRRLLDETDQDNDDMQPTRARTMPAMHAEPEPERNSISSETESPARPVRRRSSLMLVGQRPSRGSLLDTTLTTSLQAGVGVQDSPQLPARGTALSSFRFPTVPSVSRLSEGEEDETEDTTAARADVRTDQRLFAQGQASTAKSRRQSGRSGRSVRSDRSVWSDRRGGGSDTRRRGEHRHRSSRVSRPRARRPVSEAPSQSPSLSPSGTSTHRRSPRVFIASRSPSPSPTYARVANLTPPNMAETLPHTASGPSMLSQTMGASVSSSVERTRTHHHHHRHHHSGGSASNSDSARHQYHEEPYPQHRHSQVPPPSQRQYQENTGTEKRERRRAKSAIPRFDSLSRKARKSDTRPVRVHLVNTSPRTSPFSNTLPAGSPQLFRSLQDLSHSP